MIKIFWGGEGGGWGWGSSEGCLKWGGREWGLLRNLSKNILKQGWVKAKVVVGRRGFEGVTTPDPPENFNHTLGSSNLCVERKLQKCLEMSECFFIQMP